MNSSFGSGFFSYRKPERPWALLLAVCCFAQGVAAVDALAPFGPVGKWIAFVAMAWFASLIWADGRCSGAGNLAPERLRVRAAVFLITFALIAVVVSLAHLLLPFSLVAVAATYGVFVAAVVYVPSFRIYTNKIPRASRHLPCGSDYEYEVQE